jgi:predicted DsbA family dithiol-disulfide isomerase
MNMNITYYVEVTSSWCHWAEPAWAELKRRYAGKVGFDWQIALLGTDALPTSPKQADWFYRRSGTITGSPYMLNSAWLEPGVKEFLAPNCVALAARDLGAAGDEVRLALAQAAMREGRKINGWEESMAIAANVAGINQEELMRRARSPDVEKTIRKTTAEFHALQVTQRPTFVLDSCIADRTVFSGFWRLEPLVAAVEAMLADLTAYASWKAHFGDPPAA